MGDHCGGEWGDDDVKCREIIDVNVWVLYCLFEREKRYCFWNGLALS